jgi:glucokinase
MAVLGIDLGGTKLAAAVFSAEGLIVYKEVHALEGRTGNQVGRFITSQISSALQAGQFRNEKITAICISVPGISHKKDNTVWAPNIPGWEVYPLFDEVKDVVHNIPLIIESDRSCYILGEVWKGAAQGCQNAVFLAVGTGVGAGIMMDGRVLHGTHGIAGAVGWMALNPDYKEAYKNCGFFEYHASGAGIAHLARNKVQEQKNEHGVLKKLPVEYSTAHDVFAAYATGDAIAKGVLDAAIVYWGMAVANIVSLLNPEKIILGGGVFGPAQQFIPAIREEALKWAQPISMQQVSIASSTLGSDAGIYGAGYLAMQATQSGTE